MLVLSHCSAFTLQKAANKPVCLLLLDFSIGDWTDWICWLGDCLLAKSMVGWRLETYSGNSDLLDSLCWSLIWPHISLGPRPPSLSSPLSSQPGSPLSVTSPGRPLPVSPAAQSASPVWRRHEESQTSPATTWLSHTAEITGATGATGARNIEQYLTIFHPWSSHSPVLLPAHPGPAAAAAAAWVKNSIAG